MALKTNSNAKARFLPLVQQLARLRSVVLLAAAAAASIFAQDPTPAPQTGPFAHRDTAKAAAERNPIGIPHLQHAMSMRGELGVTSDDSFRVVNANTDDIGGTHVRMQQYYKGVKVENGQVISHTNARGEYAPFTNALKTNINIRTEPLLPQQAALDYLARKIGPAGPNTAVPKIELVILPLMERYVIATGAPVQAPQPLAGDPHVPDKPGPGDGE